MHILNAALAVAQGLVEVAGSALGSGFIAEFVRSESGEVSPKQGFPVAWTGGLLIAAAVVLGAPDTARAGSLQRTEEEAAPQTGSAHRFVPIKTAPTYFGALARMTTVSAKECMMTNDCGKRILP